MNFNNASKCLFKLLCSTLLFLVSSNALFATIIKGVVKDNDGYTIPYASIAVKGTNLGTSANEDGDYFIQLPEGDATLVVRMLGYKTVSKTIKVSGAEMKVDFVINYEGQELESVVVMANAEDPAYAIMRKVIANKKKNNTKLKTFETDVYLKGKLHLRSLPKKFFGEELSDDDVNVLQKELNLDSTNNGILFLLEQFTKYYYKAPNKSFNKINAIKTSGDAKGLGFATMPAIVNVYENNVTIMSGINPRGFISPAHTNAFQYYKYQYMGSYMEDGMMIDKIQFWPKRKKEPTFRGTLYVVENDWTFQQLELILDKNAQIETVDTLILRQQYRKAKEGNWVIQQQVLYPVISLMGFEFAGNFLTNYANTKVNEAIDDNVFKGNVISVYDSNALDTKDKFWEEHRPVNLSKEEVADYQFKDSVYVAQIKKKDSLYNATIKDFSVGGILLTGAYYKKQNNKIGVESLISSIGFNTVEGLRVGINPYWHHGLGKGDSLHIVWRNHYGFANAKLQSMLHFSYLNIDSSFIGKQFRLWGNVGRDVFQINPQEPINSLLNSYITLFNGYNFMKLYQAAKVELGAQQSFGNGLSISASINFEDRAHLENNTNFSFVNEKRKRFTENNPQELPEFLDHKAAIINLGIRYQPGWKFVQYPEFKRGFASNAPIFEVNYTKGLKGIFNSSTDFDRWQACMQHEFSMKRLGAIQYRLEGGGFINTNYVGSPDHYFVKGNRTSIANNYLNSFQTVPYFAYSGVPKYYGQGNIEWHLNGFITNKIPGLKQLNWHLILSSKGLYQDSKDYYYEYGVGLENIGFKMFKFFRVDYYIGKGSLHDNWRNGFRLGSKIPLTALGM